MNANSSAGFHQKLVSPLPLLSIALFSKYGTQHKLCWTKFVSQNFPEAIAPRKGVRWPHASLLLAGWSVDILRNEQPWKEQSSL